MRLEYVAKGYHTTVDERNSASGCFFAVTSHACGHCRYHLLVDFVAPFPARPHNPTLQCWVRRAIFCCRLVLRAARQRGYYPATLKRGERGKGGEATRRWKGRCRAPITSTSGISFGYGPRLRVSHHKKVASKCVLVLDAPG